MVKRSLEREYEAGVVVSACLLLAALILAWEVLF
jgi:hypothetical protein